MIANTSDPLVSCLCPTYGRVALLRRAVSCFLRQTYEPRELVVVYRLDDVETEHYLASLGAASVRAIGIPALPLLGPGSLRNIAMEAAHGHYVAVWDDDDWYGPTRLAEQIRTLSKAGVAGCLLSRVLLYDAVRQSAFVSVERTWEGSLVAQRAAMPAYSALRRGSDTELVRRMVAAEQLVGLDRPHLYVYVLHGGNLWNRDHWEKNLLGPASAMSRGDSQRVKALLDS